MPIAMVAAVARNRVIGLQGKLPWRLPADLAFFKRLTLGHTILMGRKTYQSLGRALPGRRNLVLTRDLHFTAPGCIVVHSPEEAVSGETAMLYVIGGQQVYRAFLPLAERLYITQVEEEFPGDAWFPVIDDREWRVASSTAGVVDAKNPHPHRFVVYERLPS
jgi:dihydrofolate reductase